MQQLKNYDDAFGKFFDRLAADGINKSNTLFVFTVEEGDHFVGAPPTPANCDGVNTPCTYSLVGEINGNLAGPARHPAGDHDAVHRPRGHGADDLPHRQPGADGSRSRADFGRALGRLTGGQSVHRARPTSSSVALADSGRDEGAPHGHGGPATDADTDDVRRPRLLPVRELRGVRRAAAPSCVFVHAAGVTRPSRGTTAASRSGDRDDLARHRRTGCPAGRPGQEDLGRPRGYPRHDPVARGAHGQLRPRRSGPRRGAPVVGTAAVAPSAPRDLAPARSKSTSSSTRRSARSARRS